MAEEHVTPQPAPLEEMVTAELAFRRGQGAFDAEALGLLSTSELLTLDLVCTLRQILAGLIVATQTIEQLGGALSGGGGLGLLKMLRG